MRHDAKTYILGNNREHMEKDRRKKVIDGIMVEDYESGEQRLVELHDGSIIRLRKLDREFEPTDRLEALILVVGIVSRL